MEYKDFFSGTNRLDLTLLECQLTYTCNIRCDYCFNPHHKRGNELSTNEWKRAIGQGGELGAKACVFNGGEPLLNDACVELIGHAYSVGMRTAISTNGMLFTKEILRGLVPVLNVLQISIHPWRYIDDDLRGGIEEFAEHVRVYKAYGGRKAVFNVVLYRGLTPKLRTVLHMVADIAGDNLDAIGIQAASPYGQGYLNPGSIPTFEDCEEASKIIEQCREELRMNIEDKVSDYFFVKPNTWGAYGAIVNPDGYVYPMIEGADSITYIFKEMTFDNVRDRSLSDIWANSDAFNRFRGVEWHQEPCRSCHLRYECRGGSRLNAYVLTKDMFKADPFCVLAPDHDRVTRFYKNNQLELMGIVP